MQQAGCLILNVEMYDSAFAKSGSMKIVLRDAIVEQAEDSTLFIDPASVVLPLEVGRLAI